KKQKIYNEMKKLRDDSIRLQLDAYDKMFNVKCKELLLDVQKRGTTESAYRRELELLRVMSSDMGTAIDSQTGLTTFADAGNEAKIWDDIVAGAKLYAAACEALTPLLKRASERMYDITPGMPIDPFTLDPKPGGYDGAPAGGELAAFATKQ